MPEFYMIFDRKIFFPIFLAPRLLRLCFVVPSDHKFLQMCRRSAHKNNQEGVGKTDMKRVMFNVYAAY